MTEVGSAKSSLRPVLILCLTRGTAGEGSSGTRDMVASADKRPVIGFVLVVAAAWGVICPFFAAVGEGCVARAD